MVSRDYFGERPSQKREWAKCKECGRVVRKSRTREGLCLACGKFSIPTSFGFEPEMHYKAIAKKGKDKCESDDTK